MYYDDDDNDDDAENDSRNWRSRFYWFQSMYPPSLAIPR
jgi:hypothetical protein